MDDDDASLNQSQESEAQFFRESAPGRKFNLVIAFADTTTRNRALALYDRLAQGLLKDCEFQCRWYQFKDFENPGIRTRSAEMSRQADMIIVSLRAAKELPELLREWLSSSLQRDQSDQTALVGLITTIETHQAAISPVQVELETLSKDAGVQFFVHYFDEDTPAVKSGSGEAPSTRHPKRRFRFEDEPLQRPPRTGWGLNE